MESEHAHHHHVHGAAPRRTAAFAIATGLNLVFVVAEFIYGMLAHSMALVADAAHNLGDVAGLLLAWGASVLARRRPTSTRTYGFGKATILAALANALLLFMTVGGVAWEAIGRLSAPPEVEALTVIVIAALGVVINGLGAALFMRGHEDVNVRAAFLHLAADTGVSVGVVLTGVVLFYTDWIWLDPVISLVISAVILYTTWSLLRESFNLSMDAVPRGVDIDEVKQFLRELAGVIDVHDLHVWAMSTNENALTAHMVAEPEVDRAVLLQDIDEAMRERFAICHSTIQIEPPDVDDCVSRHPGD